METLGDNYEKEILEYLTSSGMLGDPAHGIALRAIAEGRENLQGRQIDVFDEYIEEKYFNQTCKRCGCEIPLPDIIAALQEKDEKCGFCRTQSMKED